MEDEIKKLFQTRDRAVGKQDIERFRSTQLSDVEYSNPEGYMKIDSLTTEVLFTHKESNSVYLAFVKETYRPKDRPSYYAYVVYYTVKTTDGWKIYRVR